MSDNKNIKDEITKLLASPDSHDHIKAAILEADYTIAQNDGSADVDPDFIAWKVRRGNI